MGKDYTLSEARKLAKIFTERTGQPAPYEPGCGLVPGSALDDVCNKMYAELDAIDKQRNETIKDPSPSNENQWDHVD